MIATGRDKLEVQPRPWESEPTSDMRLDANEGKERKEDRFGRVQSRRADYRGRIAFGDSRGSKNQHLHPFKPWGLLA